MASESPQPEVETEVVAVAGANRRVLVVDDEGAVRRVVVGALRGAGYQVTAAGSGREALELCARERFDLLVVDVSMPQMAGEEFVGRQRARDGLTPVLFMSGNLAALSHSHESATTLAKPFRIDSLLSAAARTLEAPS